MQAMIQEFVDERFGRVRVLEEGDGTILFCGADVARALGYRNTRSAVKRHCRYGVKRTVPHPQNPRRLLDMFFLPEGDLYRLIIGSKLPSAVAFEKWVFDVLLPGLRAAGGYTVRRPEISALLFEKERQVQDLTAQLAERKDLELFASQLMRAGGGISMLRMARGGQHSHPAGHGPGPVRGGGEPVRPQARRGAAEPDHPHHAKRAAAFSESVPA